MHLLKQLKNAMVEFRIRWKIYVLRSGKKVRIWLRDGFEMFYNLDIAN